MASLSPNAQAIYQYLITKVIPTNQVTTYGDVSKATIPYPLNALR